MPTLVKKKNNFTKKLIMLIICSVMFLAGFVLNITSSQALFNYNLNVVPILQSNPTLSSDAFVVFMNVVSNIFNPILCAAYIVIFFLISYRKLEILIFLIWFIFLSWVLSLLKEAIHQPRPYWISDQIQMLEWQCYTEYGCPSGHSMMGLVLIQFVIRFFARVHKTISKYIPIFYFLGLLLELLVMFSRVFLGMHAINQVLFGFMLGMYSLIPYYLFLERGLLLIIRTAIDSKDKKPIIFIWLSLILICFGVEVLATFIPTYDNGSYMSVIQTIPKCEQASVVRSFQYRCFEDSAIIMGAFSIFISIIFMKNPQNFTKLLNYSRLSWRFVMKFIFTLIIGLIPLALFLNPLWGRIDTTTDGSSLLLWACDNLGFFFGCFFLIWIGYWFCDRLEMEARITPFDLENYCQFETVGLQQDSCTIEAEMQSRRKQQPAIQDMFV